MPEWITPDSAQSTKSPQHVLLKESATSGIHSAKSLRIRQNAQKPKQAWQSWRLGRTRRHNSHSSEQKLHSGQLAARQSVISIFCKQVCRRTGAFTSVSRISIHTGSVPQQSSIQRGKSVSWHSSSCIRYGCEQQVVWCQTIPVLHEWVQMWKDPDVQAGLCSGLSARWCRRGWSMRVGWGGGLEEKSSLQKAQREGWRCAICGHGTGGDLEFPHGCPGCSIMCSARLKCHYCAFGYFGR